MSKILSTMVHYVVLNTNINKKSGREVQRLKEKQYC